MKIKGDFVTNSSTASFIMVGWKLPQTKESVIKIANALAPGSYDDMTLEMILKFINQNTNQVVLWNCSSSEDGLEENTIYIGYYTKVADDEIMDDNDIGIIEALDDKDLIKTLGLENVKLVTGTTVA